MKRGTHNDTFGKLIGNRLGAAPPGHSRELIKCIIHKHENTLAQPISCGLRRHHPLSIALDAGVRTSCSGDHACYLHHTCLKHAAHTPLHADTAAALTCMCPLRCTYRTSHDHMIARMWHVSLAPSLSNCRLIRRAQPRLTSAIFVCVILAGTSVRRTIHRSISMLLDGSA